MEELILDNDKHKRWVDKYRPKKVKDIIGNNFAIARIQEWLEKYDKNRETMTTSPKKNKKQKQIKVMTNESTSADDSTTITIKKGKKNSNSIYRSCLMITGSHGIGKTCTAYAILKEMNYKVYRINFNRINQLKNSKDLAAKMLSGSNIFNIITGTQQEKMALIIDDLESIISPAEKKFIESLLKENEIKWGFPIIFIADNKHSKFVNAVKPITFEVQMPLPKESSMEFLLMKICQQNKMILTSREVATLIIDHAQYDYRRLLCTLEDLYDNYGHDEITEECVEKYFDFSKRKDIDNDIFSSTKNLFSDKKMSLSERLILFETERTIIPLMVQQNHISCIGNYTLNKDPNHILSMAKDLTKSIARGDVIENYIYGSSNWILQETHGFFSCAMPTQIISNNIDKKSFDNDVLYHRYETVFPLDLNRTSIKYINIKNVKNASQDFPHMDTTDFINAKRVIIKLLDEKKFDEYEELMREYNATPSGVQSVIKVDKILDTKTSIPATTTRKIGIHTNPELLRKEKEKKENDKKSEKKKTIKVKKTSITTKKSGKSTKKST